MSTVLAAREVSNVSADLQEKVLLGGDLSRLTAQERLSYYNAVCVSVGLNPLTRPFEYIILNGKLQLYTRKDCTDQLRSNRNVSVKIISREVIDDIFIVTSQASDSTGRTDESIGAVLIKGLQGTDKANAMMKAETKAKRRVTLSFCGLGLLDETEIEDVRQEPETPTATTQDVGTRILDKMKKKDTIKTVEQDGASDVAPPLDWDAFLDYAGDDPDRMNVVVQLKEALAIGLVSDLQDEARISFIKEFQQSCKDTGVPCQEWVKI